jgi:hypothetical protein
MERVRLEQLIATDQEDVGETKTIYRFVQMGLRDLHSSC